MATHRTQKPWAKCTAAAAAIAAAVAGGWLIASPAADAYPNNPNVHISGAVQCPPIGGPYDHVWGMRWDGNRGDHVSVSTFGPNGARRSYALDVHQVPYGPPETFTVSTYCSVTGWHSKQVSVSRPWASNNAGINVEYY